MRVLIIVTLLTLVFGCASRTASLSRGDFPEVKGENLEIREKLIGNWHGRMPVDGSGYHEWRLSRYSDGTYETRFTDVDDDGRKYHSHMVGLWGSSKNILFTIYRGAIENHQFYPVTGEDPKHYNVYIIDKITDTEMVYRHNITGDIFKAKKVVNGHLN